MNQSMNIRRGKLYHFPMSRSARVKWLLHELRDNDFAIIAGESSTSTPPNTRQPSGLDNSFLRPFPLILLQGIFCMIAIRFIASG